MYRKAFHIVIFVFLLINVGFSPLPALSAETGSSEAKEQNVPSPGLELKIKSDRKKYQPYQPIYIIMAISNKSQKEVIFNKRFAITKSDDFGYKSEITFKIIKPDGKEAELEFSSDVEPLAESDFVKIKKKAKYERMLDITRWYWKELGAPGIYTIKCIYNNDQTGYQQWTFDGYELFELYAWDGNIESNMVSFKIEEISKKNVMLLADKLVDKKIYWGERTKIAEMLGELQNGWALNALLSRLNIGEHEVVRNKCIEAIVKYGKFPIKRLLKLLKKKEPMTTVLAARALGILGNKKGLGVVRRELKNNDSWQIKREAMISLRWIDNETAIKDIKKYINDEEDAVRFTAVDVLKELGIKIKLNRETDRWEIAE